MNPEANLGVNLSCYPAISHLGCSLVQSRFQLPPKYSYLKSAPYLSPQPISRGSIHAGTDLVAGSGLTVLHDYTLGVIDAESCLLVLIQVLENYPVKNYVSTAIDEDHAVYKFTASDLQIVTRYPNLAVLE